MIRKLIHCLTSPRLIGLYINDSFLKIILEVSLLILIAMVPVGVQSITASGEHFVSHEVLQSKMMDIYIKDEYRLVDQTLSGTEKFSLNLDSVIYLFNPKNDVLTSKEIGLSVPYLYELRENEINFYMSGMLVKTMHYATFSMNEIDLRAAFAYDYLERGKLEVLLQEIQIETKGFWLSIELVALFFTFMVSIIITALFSTFFMWISNPQIGFKYRFRLAMNSSFITTLFILFGFLFGIPYLFSLGLGLQMLYSFRATTTIVRIERVDMPKGE